MRGGAGDDDLHGDAGLGVQRGADLGADRLDGGAGDDQLHVGDGLDVLTGGAGQDGFIFKYMAPVSPRGGRHGARLRHPRRFTAPPRTRWSSTSPASARTRPAPTSWMAAVARAAQVASFFSGAAAASGGEGVMVLTDQAFASGALAVQAAQGEQAGDMVVYFNSTVGVASLLVVSAPDTAASIARFTDITSLDQLQTAGFTAGDFMFA